MKKMRPGRMIAIAIFVIISAVGIFRISSISLDKKAEQVSDNMYPRDSNGVIEGLQSIVYKSGQDSAILFIHGFASSPAVFAETINHMKKKTNSDLFAPLLPYNGRDLKTLSASDNKKILNYIETVINELSQSYKKVTVVGLSYGGAFLTKLAYINRIPPNVNIVLYAPSLYIKSNNILQRNIAKIYSHWRDYCDYRILGCGYPNYDSADESAKTMFDKEKAFHYIDVPALLTMYKFDLDNRIDLRSIRRPYNIIMAVDDNRISYNKIKSICFKNNRYCKFYSFKSGKHLLHWGKNQQKFEDLLIDIHNQ